MASKDNKQRFGLSTSVEEHMAILKVLAKNNNDAISRFWKGTSSEASAQKAMLFHTLAMLDPQRLHAWIASTPLSWWQASTSTPPGNRYDSIAGGMLHYLHHENRPVFMELIDKSPHIFQSPSCRFYMAEWCADLQPEDLEIFQPLLTAQPSSWYATHPSRIHWLLRPSGTREEELMLSAAIAENGVVHPLLEAKYPGIQTCAHVAHGMFNETKQKKQFIRKWMAGQSGPQQEKLVLELPELGGPDSPG